MNNTKKALRIKLFILMAAFLLILLSLFTYNRVSSLISSIRSVNEIHLVKYGIEKVKLSLKECETNVRGYALSKDSVFLPLVNKSLTAIDNSVIDLSQTIDKDQQKNFNALNSLINTRTARFKEALLSDTIIPHQILLNKQLMDQIDFRIAQMMEFEDVKMHESNAELKEDSILTPLSTLGLIIFTVSFLVYIYFHLTKELKKSRELQSKILEQNSILSEKNKFIETIINSSDDLIAVIDKEYKLINLNDTAVKFLSKAGFENALGKNIKEIKPGFESSAIPAFFQNCFEGNKIKLDEYRSATFGEVFEINLIPLIDNKHVFAIVLIAHNVTKSVSDRIKLEELNEKLEYQNEIYRHAEEMLKFGNYRADFKTKTLAYSDNLYRMLGCEPGEFKPGREAFLNFVHPDDKKLLENAGASAYADEISKRWDFRMIRKNGELFYVRTTANVFTDQNGDKWLIGTIQDISEEKQKEFQLININEQLKFSEYRNQLMVGEVEEYAILFLSKEGIIENWNKGIKRIHGYDEDEIVGKNFSIFYIKNDKEKNIPELLLEQATVEGKSKHEGWRLRKNGTAFWGYVVLTAVYDNGELIGFSKIVRDLTERKIADENSLKYAKILEQKNQDLEKINKELQSFAYISSHDLQEPLRKIQTFSDKILGTEESTMSETGKDYFKRMQSAAMRMQQLIEDLLEYAQTSTTEKKFVKVELKNLVTDVQNEMKESLDTSGASIHVIASCEMNVIEFQFRQLLQNLFSNAIKFAKKDQPSLITVNCNKINAAEMGFTVDAKGNYLHIIVQDNGIGFDTAYNDMIFELFKRLHGRSEYKGTGIGLAICRKIIENHHGFIKAEGQPGEGAAFHIYIPDN